MINTDSVFIIYNHLLNNREKLGGICMSSSAKLEELRNKKRELKNELQSMDRKEGTLTESVEIAREKLDIQELTEKVKAKRAVLEQLESMIKDLEKVKPKIQQKRANLYSIREYFNQKAAENRHNEMAAYLMFIAGIILFVGGLMVTFYTSDNLNWFIFLPYNLTSNPASFLGSALTLSGIILSIYGTVVGIFYSRKRTPPIQQLYQDYSFVEKSKNSPKRRIRKKNKQ